MTDEQIIQRVKNHIDPDDCHIYFHGFDRDVALKVGRYIHGRLGPRAKPFTDRKWDILIGDLYFYELETR